MVDKKYVIDILSSKITKENEAEIFEMIEKIMHMDPEKFQRSVQEKGGTPEAILAFFEMKFAERIKDKELEEYVAKEAEELELEGDRLQDSEQNQDLIDLNEQKQQEDDGEHELFVLHKQGKTQRLQVREELERDLQDRQRALMERNLRILEALEKIREAMKQEKGMLEISGDFFKGLNTREIKQQLGFLKAMGVQEISRDEDGNILENTGEGIDIEKIIEKGPEALGEVEFAISFETLQSIEWRIKDEDLQQRFKDKGIKLDENEPTAIKGLEEPEAEKEGGANALEEDEGPEL